MTFNRVPGSHQELGISTGGSPRASRPLASGGLALRAARVSRKAGVLGSFSGMPRSSHFRRRGGSKTGKRTGVGWGRSLKSNDDPG